MMTVKKINVNTEKDAIFAMEVANKTFTTNEEKATEINKILSTRTNCYTKFFKLEDTQIVPQLVLTGTNYVSNITVYKHDNCSFFVGGTKNKVFIYSVIPFTIGQDKFYYFYKFNTSLRPGTLDVYDIEVPAGIPNLFDNIGDINTKVAEIITMKQTSLVNVLTNPHKINPAVMNEFTKVLGAFKAGTLNSAGIDNIFIEFINRFVNCRSVSKLYDMLRSGNVIFNGLTAEYPEKVEVVKQPKEKKEAKATDKKQPKEKKAEVSQEMSNTAPIESNVTQQPAPQQPADTTTPQSVEVPTEQEILQQIINNETVPPTI